MFAVTLKNIVHHVLFPRERLLSVTDAGESGDMHVYVQLVLLPKSGKTHLSGIAAVTEQCDFSVGSAFGLLLLGVLFYLG